ncbi:putative NADH dehydrogenase I chain N [Actinacidiphila reveromycinica]|uniref:NADH-quinone oxidoreductase subunit N n=1 Tax=Actinacidiphila reveromycinica TaxID=659352 RepID=A0A7U3UVC0_9ACTN|nr:NADH-quinone oxidoreductase subunit N [Streptomyces sp. SN-593]BBA99464.1 putative NADH dehydrogenase I chain N [Streptomyces sp. SN-593]
MTSLGAIPAALPGAIATAGPAHGTGAAHALGHGPGLALASPLTESVDWTAIAPAAVPAALAVLLLVADLFLPPLRKRFLAWGAVAGLALALLALIPLRAGHHATFCSTGATGGGCSYTADRFALVVQVLVLGGALLTALLSAPAVEEELPAGEFWFLLLASASGATLLPASRDLATLIVALEVTTLPSFALVGLRRGDRLGSEAALKFFLTSVTATAVSLMGVSFLYATTGTLYLDRIGRTLGHEPGQLHTLGKAGAALTLVGFAFKLAVAPFHFWVPDTYAGAPLPVAAYLSVVGKAAGFSGLILLTTLALHPYADTWGPAMGVLAALTMTVGNVGALRQRPDAERGAVRLLAWSSIGQAGYLLVPLAAEAAGRPAGYHVGTTVAYALMYAVVNLGAFAVAALVGRGAPHCRLTDFRGLYASRPAAALALAFFLLCLAGLPPGVIGLFAKVAVFSTAVDARHGWLAVIMAVNVAIALVYYLRWTALLFGRAPSGKEEGMTDSAATSDATGAAHGAADGATGATRGAAADAPAGAVAAGTPFALAAAIALAAAAGVVLSGAPQIVLRYAEGVLL